MFQSRRLQIHWVYVVILEGLRKSVVDCTTVLIVVSSTIFGELRRQSNPALWACLEEIEGIQGMLFVLVYLMGLMKTCL
jgi:hypothetical protein